MSHNLGARKSVQNEEEERVVIEDVDVSIAPPPAKRSRKKSQAFGVPKTAALKAKIDRNAAASPLLSLPREVRTRIWVLVIGDRLLHIRTLCTIHPKASRCYCYDRSTSKQIWTTSCCLLLNSEQDFFRRSKIPIEELVKQDEGDLSSCSAERKKERTLHLQQFPHYQCYYYLEEIRSSKCNVLGGHAIERYQAKEHVLQVQILQVCQQVYIEANPILWSSNTLAFSNPSQFRLFMSELVAAQKASITRLLLDFSWGTSGYFTSGETERGTSNRIVTTLTGLRTLHLYLKDAVYAQFPSAGNYDNKHEIEEWQSSAKTNEARGGFMNFRRLPLQDVTVLMLCNPEHAINIEDWRPAERIKYAEAVRATLLDPEGLRKLQQEQADAKAAKKAESDELKMSEPPCDQFSTEEECAKANQEDTDRRRIANGKFRSSRPQAHACKAEHLCLLCFVTLDRTREEARQCQKPGRCSEDYFDITFTNIDRPDESMSISVQPQDTISAILDRYIGVSGIKENVSHNVQLEGVVLKPEATVKDAGVERDGKTEVVVAITKENTPSHVVADNSDICDADGAASKES